MDMLTFEQYKKERDSLHVWMDQISKEMDVYPRNEMGLVIEEIRMTDAYKEKKALYQVVFNKLRNLNGKYVKVYKKELAAERAEKIRKLNEIYYRG